MENSCQFSTNEDNQMLYQENTLTSQQENNSQGFQDNEFISCSFESNPTTDQNVQTNDEEVLENKKKEKEHGESLEIDYESILNGKEERTTLVVIDFPPSINGKEFMKVIDEVLKIKEEKKNRIYDFFMIKNDEISKKKICIINMIHPRFVFEFHKRFNGFYFSKAESKRKRKKKMKIFFWHVQGKEAFNNFKKDEENGPFYFYDGENADKYFFHYRLENGNLIAY